jgi:hypothetical protein
MMPENAELLCEYSKEKLKHAQKSQKICNALLDATGPMGKITALLGISLDDSPPTHRATEETIILLGKLKDFWDAIEASLLKIGPGESLH